MNLKTKKTLEILGALIPAFIVVFLGTTNAFAQTEFTPLVTVDGLFKEGKATNPIEILKGIYGFAIGIGSVMAVIMIIWGGFEYMYQESFSVKSAAKERISNAFIGLGVILASFIILKTINKDLVNFNLNLPGASGQLQNLIASDTLLGDIGKLQDNLHKASMDAAVRRQEIVSLQNIVDKNDAEIKNLEKLLANAKADDRGNGEVKNIEEQLSKLKADNEANKKNLNSKKLDDISKTVESINSDSKNYFVSNEFINYGDKLDELFTSDSKSTKEFFDNIRGGLTSKKEASNKKLSGLNDIVNVDNDSKFEEKIDAAKAKGNQEIDYIDKAIKFLTFPETLIKEKDIQIVSGKLANEALKYKSAADAMESEGRKDLADRMREDVETAIKITRKMMEKECDTQRYLASDNYSSYTSSEINVSLICKK